ncbi:unnamed protein product [Oppiella nova]|uniref:Cytochrome P450 n=1 Tax=Oppiella nova TaxID=334625 RepID=A0A7R9MMX3_9ACAR|nr:unnamed protein product [Oppiella nova]CAG2180396.1 unnamed protein product [Oppiella nova]
MTAIMSMHSSLKLLGIKGSRVRSSTHKHLIKEDTIVMGNLLSVSRDPNLWPKPDVFDPNRFLDKDNKYMSALPGFTPFGIGRRICLGEKLALADLFYITVRLLKSTPEYVFALPSEITPFGIGRRICLGEKLALADLFYITVRLLKSTPDYVFALPSGEGTADLEPDPNILFLRVPKPYEILLKKL